VRADPAPPRVLRIRVNQYWLPSEGCGARCTLEPPRRSENEGEGREAVFPFRGVVRPAVLSRCPMIMRVPAILRRTFLVGRRGIVSAYLAKSKLILSTKYHFAGDIDTLFSMLRHSSSMHSGVREAIDVRHARKLIGVPLRKTAV